MIELRIHSLSVPSVQGVILDLKYRHRYLTFLHFQMSNLGEMVRFQVSTLPEVTAFKVRHLPTRRLKTRFNLRACKPNQGMSNQCCVKTKSFHLSVSANMKTACYQQQTAERSDTTRGSPIKRSGRICWVGFSQSGRKLY